MSFELPAFKRPQYPSSPEVLLSALAWSVIPRAQGSKDVGLIYKRIGGTPKKGKQKVEVRQTMPQGDELDIFFESLVHRGMLPADAPRKEDIAQAVVNSMRGVQPGKGIGYSSSAIGVAGALLQDPAGSLSVTNPPNFASLINTFYQLGGGHGTSAAELWFRAASYYGGRAPLNAIEAAFAETSLKPYLLSSEWPPSLDIAVDKNSLADSMPGWWQMDVLGKGVETPFSWFRTSWDRLCSKEWYENLPPRRWTGWAVCLLRHAMGFGFLWEANFYKELARGLLDKAKDPVQVRRLAITPACPLVPYQTGTVSHRDVAPSIRRLLTIGLGSRKAIEQLSSGIDIQAEGLAEFVVKLRGKLTLGDREILHSALSGDGDTAGFPNLLETVRYSLLARGTLEDGDSTALLRTVARNYTHVAPGPEWIVAMSAVSADPGPGLLIRLGDVLNNLTALGFMPRIDFLIGELERAGLCASASDGDEGIEIDLGFGKK